MSDNAIGLILLAAFVGVVIAWLVNKWIALA